MNVLSSPSVLELFMYSPDMCGQIHIRPARKRFNTARISRLVCTKCTCRYLARIMKAWGFVLESDWSGFRV